jgi:mannose-1-phosphate guanylyltransferase
VILAGGLGTRLRPYTFLLPKPMLPVGPKPIMEHLLEWLKAAGITDFVVSTGYLGKMLQEYFGDGSTWGVNIVYATAPPLGTAGQLKAAESKIKGRFVCVYGDAILDLDLKKAIDFHASKGADATMVIMKHTTELKYGFIDTDREGKFTKWNERPKVSGHINVGCYIMEKRFLDHVPVHVLYEMDDAFRKAKAEGAKLYALKMEGTFMDIGDRKSYRDANEIFTKRMKQGVTPKRK